VLITRARTSNLASQTQITAVTTNTFTIAKPSGYTLPTVGTVTAATGADAGTTATFTSTMNPTVGVTVQVTGLVATTGASLNITGVRRNFSGTALTSLLPQTSTVLPLRLRLVRLPSFQSHRLLVPFTVLQRVNTSYTQSVSLF
jgi:hypothetical protein